MNILSINGDRFKKAFGRLGHRVITAGAEGFFDRVLPPGDRSLENAIAAAGFIPDFILVECFSGKPFFKGIEECEYPLIVYGVDSSINLFWFKNYARLFDIVFVDQKRAAEKLKSEGIEAHWLPLAVEESEFRDLKHTGEFDIAFVGRLNDRRLKRSLLIEELNRHYRIAVGGGDGSDYISVRKAAEFHARARIGLNENIFDGITQRVFEVMASGTMLLTENIEDGLELFSDGRHLVTFTPGSLHQKAAYYLNRPEERESIAQSGRREVMRNHTYDRRANELLEIFRGRGLSRRKRYDKAFRYGESAKAYYYAALRWQNLAQDLLNRSEEACLERLKESPRDAEVHLIRGLLHAKWGSFHTAADHLFKSAESNSDDFRPYFYLGHLLNKYNRPTEACGLFKTGVGRITEAFPEPAGLALRLLNLNHLEGETWIALGDVLRCALPAWEPGFMKFQPDEIPHYPAEYYDKAAREWGSFRGWGALGECYYQAGIPDEAYGCFKLALNGEPDNPQWNFLAGAAALKIYLRDEGLEYIRKAVNDSPGLSANLRGLDLLTREMEFVSGAALEEVQV